MLWDKNANYETKVAYDDFVRRHFGYDVTDIIRFVSIGYRLYLIETEDEKVIYSYHDKSIYVIGGKYVNDENRDVIRRWDFTNRLNNLLIMKRVRDFELAKMIGVTPQMMVRYVHAKAMPSFHKIMDICDALDCDPSYFTIH